MSDDKALRLNVRFILIAMIGAGVVFALNRTGSFEIVPLKVGEEIIYRHGWPITHIEATANTYDDEREVLLKSGWPENRYALIQALPFAQNLAIWMGIAIGFPLLFEIAVSALNSSSQNKEEEPDG